MRLFGGAVNHHHAPKQAIFAAVIEANHRKRPWKDGFSPRPAKPRAYEAAHPHAPIT
jgi:hypothetical protein